MVALETPEWQRWSEKNTERYERGVPEMQIRTYGRDSRKNDYHCPGAAGCLDELVCGWT